jgi:hypothetical protein
MWTMRATLVAAPLALTLGWMVSAPAVSAAEPAEVVHEVQPGDNLHVIAGYYYGDARQWTRIWKANRNQISNPNQIARGISLRVPDGAVPAESYADFMTRVRARASGSPSSGAAPSTLQPPTTPAGQSPSPPPPRKQTTRK